MSVAEAIGCGLIKGRAYTTPEVKYMLDDYADKFSHSESQLEADHPHLHQTSNEETVTPRPPPRSVSLDPVKQKTEPSTFLIFVTSIS
jgi:hypothetical protein